MTTENGKKIELGPEPPKEKLAQPEVSIESYKLSADMTTNPMRKILYRFKIAQLRRRVEQIKKEEIR